jgi:hypothetical protein
MTFCLWMIQNGYDGLIHDSQLYTLQALARLQPDVLGGDIFLRYGSQDDFTLFSPLFGVAIQLLGLEHAAAFLTLSFHAAFLTAAWFLARALMPAPLAWIGVALLASLPSEYSAYGTFRYLENFLTPRLASEALVLGGLAALLARRYLLAIALIVVAGLLHPLMAAAGVAAGLLIEGHLRGFKWRWLAATIISGGLLLAVVAPTGYPLRFDDTWFELIKSRTMYLFVTDWRIADWAKLCVPLTTLLMATLLLAPARAALLSKAVLIATLCGIVLTAIGADGLRLVLVTQLQPWRWMWLAGVISVLVAVPLVSQCWQRGGTARAALLLLLSAWLCRAEFYALVLAALAIAASFAAVRGQPASERVAKAVSIGSLALLAICLVINLSNGVMSSAISLDSGVATTLLQMARVAGRDGVLPVVVIALAWMLASRPTIVRVATLGAVSALVALILLPMAIGEWTAVAYDRKAQESFAPWRALIPPRSEVLWPDGLSSTWLLLQRPGYLTTGHLATILFSRDAALELKRRASALAPFMNEGSFAPWPDDARRAEAFEGPLTVDGVCSSADVKFIVTRRPLHATPLAELPQGAPRRYRGLKLYRCGP